MKLLINYFQLKRKNKLLLLFVLVQLSVNLKIFAQEKVYCNSSENFTTYVLNDSNKIVTNYKTILLLNPNNLIVDTLNRKRNTFIQALYLIDSTEFSVAFLDYAQQIKVKDNKFVIKKEIKNSDKKIKTLIHTIESNKKDKENHNKLAIIGLNDDYLIFATKTAIFLANLPKKNIKKVFDVDKKFTPYGLFPILTFTPEGIYFNAESNNKLYFFSLNGKRIIVQFPRKNKNEKWYLSYDIKTKTKYFIKKSKKIKDIYKYSEQPNELIYIGSFSDDIIQIYNKKILTYNAMLENKKTIICTVFEELELNLNKPIIHILPEVTSLSE